MANPKTARIPLALGALVFAFAVSGCLDDKTTCTVDGVEHKVGESFPSSDGCNTCSCDADGAVSCTLMACVRPCTYEDGGVHEPDTTFLASDGCNTCTCDSTGAVSCTEMACAATCTYDGVVHQIGDTFPAADGCNTCTCEIPGAISCTEMACAVTCTYGEAVHQVGDSFPADDGCNSCSCTQEGTVVCTLMPCVSGCVYEGQSYNTGDEFPAADGCNTCGCNADHTVTCTRLGCPTTCNYDRQTWNEGDSFPAIDGCNTCTCMAEGQIGCTEIACPTCDAETEWWRLYYGHSAEECASIRFECVEGSERFTNDCGCGCEQPDTCEREIECYYPECDSSIVAVDCPYSTIDSSRDCSAELACPDDGSSCGYPGQDLGCGICFRTEDGGCGADGECGAGNICEPLRCACEPVRVCVPGCTENSQCGEGQVCGAGARCVAKTCGGEADCPANFRCDGGGCLREPCTASESCDGTCVLGQCYSEPGTCNFPVP